MSQTNKTTYKTPGVYIEEIPVLPPSVVQVATAVPAFIGYTEKATMNGKNVTRVAVRLYSLTQYVECFGDAFNNLKATVNLNDDGSIGGVEITPKYQLFNAIRMFFDNGGSTCYVISIGPYSSSDALLSDFLPSPPAVSCFDVLAKEDEPTLIVIPDAVLLNENGFNDLMAAALQQCGSLQDRFTIMDVYDGFKDIAKEDVITKFRNGIDSPFLNYGAAYYPWLRTSLPFKITYANTLVKKANVDQTMSSLMPGNVLVTRLDNIVKDKKKMDDLIQPFPSSMGPIPGKADLEARLTIIKNMLTGLIGLTGFNDLRIPGNASVDQRFREFIKPGTGASFTPVEKLMREAILIDKSFPGGALNKVDETAFSGYQVNAIVAKPDIYGTPPPHSDSEAAVNISPRVLSLYTDTYLTLTGFSNEIQNIADSIEKSLESSVAFYANLKSAIKREGIIVPPGGAIAGIYASVDGTRGVWKAPANVSLNTVTEPMVSIDNNMQDNLNVDSNGGKSINAIRTFTGKGILVWGARTLAGNDNEWRYIPVRRFFIMVEESVKKATGSFVFEPNDANTWAKVMGMLENYLILLWQQGALAGAKPEHAFYVRCGPGQTMTEQDILEGRLIVEIGLAAVRPAEFIILRFSQKLQVS
jgi:phage tail sheath protein FI